MPNEPIHIAQSKEPIYLLPKMSNRHGLVAGAAGTGKTVTVSGISVTGTDSGNYTPNTSTTTTANTPGGGTTPSNASTTTTTAARERASPTRGCGAIARTT